MKIRNLFMRTLAIGLVASIVSYQGNVGTTLANAANAAKASREYDLKLPKRVTLQKEDKAVLNQAKQVAVKQGKRARNLIADIDSDGAYREAVSEILALYYSDTSVDAQADDFVNGLKSCAKEIVKNYEEAYDERSKANDLAYNTDRIIVQFEKNVSDESIREAMDTISDGGELLETDEIDSDLPQYKKDRIKQAIGKQQYKTAVIELGEDQSTSRAIDQYKNLEGVYSVERDQILHKDSLPSNDPSTSSQWGLIQSNLNHAWELMRLYKNDTRQIWAAVIDSGVDINHPDLNNYLGL